MPRSDDGADIRVLGEDPVDQQAVGDVALIKARPAVYSRLPVTRLSRITGLIPASRQADATVLPMYPAPPGISTFVIPTRLRAHPLTNGAAYPKKPMGQAAVGRRADHPRPPRLLPPLVPLARRHQARARWHPTAPGCWPQQPPDPTTARRR